MEERKQRMIEMRGKGWTLARIAREFGVTRERVRHILGNTGRCPVREAKHREVVTLIDQGLTVDEIGRRLGVKARTVKKWAEYQPVQAAGG